MVSHDDVVKKWFLMVRFAQMVTIVKIIPLIQMEAAIVFANEQ
jgi:hypothetical protein